MKTYRRSAGKAPRILTLALGASKWSASALAALNWRIVTLHLVGRILSTTSWRRIGGSMAYKLVLMIFGSQIITHGVAIVGMMFIQSFMKICHLATVSWGEDRRMDTMMRQALLPLWR